MPSPAQKLFENLAARTYEERLKEPNGGGGGGDYYDIPCQELQDLTYMYGDMSALPDDYPPLPAETEFEEACRGSGSHNDISVLRKAIATGTRTPACLHYGLVLALAAGNVAAVQMLLEEGRSPVARRTPYSIWKAPRERHVELFDVLLRCNTSGWTLNTPARYSFTLVELVVQRGDKELLRWFLDHGADPNWGRSFLAQPGSLPIHNSGAALEAAAKFAADGNLAAEMAQMLLDAGANVHYGNPLHEAAGLVLPEYYDDPPVPPSKEFDAGRVPVMKVLLDGGADVNGRVKTKYVEPDYPLVQAVMVGAVQRARFLLECGADPTMECQCEFKSAVYQAELQGTAEMKQLLREGVKKFKSK